MEKVKKDPSVSLVLIYTATEMDGREEGSNEEREKRRS
jgi:hypothetical protein